MHPLMLYSCEPHHAKTGLKIFVSHTDKKTLTCFCVARLMCFSNLSGTGNNSTELPDGSCLMLYMCKG